MDWKKLIVGAAAAVLALGGGGVAYAVGGDSGEQVSGPKVEKAKSAALDAVGGGTVTEVERDDGDGVGLFEVEVKRDDGSQVDVHLDRALNVVGQGTGDDGSNDQDGSNED
jgi:uncharacterized membrane protein YkoI